LAVNTPRGYSVASIHVTRIEDGAAASDVAIVRPPSPWPDHFTIIGVDQGNGRDARREWPAGHYRVSMAFEPGAIERSVDIMIDEPDPDETAASGAPPVVTTP
jgi:hypothetical protein